jgi:hypothetical protein
MRKVQFTRKQGGLNVADRIDLITVTQDDTIRQYLTERRADILAKIAIENFHIMQEDEVPKDIKEHYLKNSLQYETALVKIYIKKLPSAS